MPLTLQDLATFVRIARPQNILIGLGALAIATWLASRGAMAPFLAGHFWAEAGILALLMAGGFWINDVYDHKIDLINKPEKTFVGRRISAKKVITAYIIVTFACLALSIWLLPLRLAGINLIAALLLYVYSQFFKRTSVVGNLIIALLTSLVVLAGSLIDPEGYRLAIVWAAIFAFQITFLREVTKDLEDLRGDMQFRLHTLPIQIGIRRTKWVLAGGILVFLLSCHLPWIVHLALWGGWALRYIFVSVLIVQLPMLFNLYFLRQAYRPQDFHTQSQLLKLVILTGIISLFFLP
jgi:4-hydroxybenzoate polyprenyltransferase